MKSGFHSISFRLFFLTSLISFSISANADLPIEVVNAPSAEACAVERNASAAAELVLGDTRIQVEPRVSELKEENFGLGEQIASIKNRYASTLRWVDRWIERMQNCSLADTSQSDPFCNVLERYPNFPQLFLNYRSNINRLIESKTSELQNSIDENLRTIASLEEELREARSLYEEADRAYRECLQNDEDSNNDRFFIDFEDLHPSMYYEEGSSFRSNGVLFSVKSIGADVFPDGTAPFGRTYVFDGAQWIGGADGLAIMPSNVATSFDVPSHVKVLTVDYFYGGGDLYIEVNGEAKGASNILAFDGISLEGVTLTVTPGESSPDSGLSRGSITFQVDEADEIGFLALGGQETLFDNIREVELDDSDEPSPEPTVDPDLPLGITVDFEDLTTSNVYERGESFTSNNVEFQVKGYGDQANGSIADDQANGSKAYAIDGKQWSPDADGMVVYPSNLAIEAKPNSLYRSASFDYFYGGGEIYIEVNGEGRLFSSLEEVSGTLPSGFIVSLEAGRRAPSSNVPGGSISIEAQGGVAVRSLAIGGQELLIDNINFQSPVVFQSRDL